MRIPTCSSWLYLCGWDFSDNLRINSIAIDWRKMHLLVLSERINHLGLHGIFNLFMEVHNGFTEGDERGERKGRVLKGDWRPIPVL